MLELTSGAIRHRCIDPAKILPQVKVRSFASILLSNRNVSEDNQFFCSVGRFRDFYSGRRPKAGTSPELIIASLLVPDGVGADHPDLIGGGPVRGHCLPLKPPIIFGYPVAGGTIADQFIFPFAGFPGSCSPPTGELDNGIDFMNEGVFLIELCEAHVVARRKSKFTPLGFDDQEIRFFRSCVILFDAWQKGFVINMCFFVGRKIIAVKLFVDDISGV